MKEYRFNIINYSVVIIVELNNKNSISFYLQINNKCFIFKEMHW